MVHGWISHSNPLTFDPQDVSNSSNGLALFFCQVLIILALCYILGTLFQKIGQPRVLGELLAGVVLGPTAFGNIPYFSTTIVPEASLPLLKLTSNIGLVFFILLVGLETDTDLIRKHAKRVALIALPGMAIPFAISVGLAKFLYDKSTDQSTNFSTFMLFVATVMAVTSLSILSRIISELKLLNTVLGSVTIAAGALNDLLGYILLALGSALGSGGKQINALYQLLVALALFLVQWFVMRPALFYLIDHSGFNLTGPSQQRVPGHLLILTLLGALISAFVTDACNLHPILGSLLFGISCPHGNFAVMVTEQIETISVGILLPLYFVTSGLNADFTLVSDGSKAFINVDTKQLNTGLIWGEIFLVFAVVFVSKFLATTACTRLAGFSWREASFVGALMQSKSIIELIILNAGHEIGVLSSQVYSMLFLTFILSTLTVRPLAFLLGNSEAEPVPHKDTSASEHKPTSTPSRDMDKDPLLDPLSMFVAITSNNPTVEALVALMQILSKRKGDHSDVHLDLVRFLPNDSSNSSILRQLHQRRDEMLDALKLVAHIYKVPLLGDLGRLRQNGAAKDMVTVNDTHDIFEDLQVRISAVERPSVTHDHQEDLGQSLILVPWESNAHLSASFTSHTSADGEGHASKAGMFSKASMVATELFRTNNRSACGVLLDSDLLTTSAPQGLHQTSHARQAEKLGLNTITRKPRVVVPFFGGSDDRACIEMVKRLAQGFDIEAIVVTVDRHQLSDHILRQLQEVARKHTKLESEEKHTDDEAHLATVNLATVNVEEEQYADARMLFRTGATMNNDVDEHGATQVQDSGDVQTHSALPDKRNEMLHEHGELTSISGPTDEEVQHIDNVTIVTLQASHVQDTDTKTTVEAVMKYIQSLVDARFGDTLILGRGKLQQRTSDFRLQVEAYGRNFLQHPSPDYDAQHNRIKDIQHIGRVLGACCEATLMSHLSANVLVLQSKSQA